MKVLDRRMVVGGGLLAAVTPLYAQDASYKEYPYKDVFAGLLGPGAPQGSDIEAAIRIAAGISHTDHYQAMGQLAAISETGSTHELFNMRWKTVANPLIVKFFSDIGYAKGTYPSDCTPWWAATLSWCLKRTGHAIPADPASSQSYLGYGPAVASPIPGDICVFTDVGDEAHGHVGLFVSQTSTSVTLIGGNQLGVDRTGCGPGFRASKIAPMTLPKNPGRNRHVDVHYFRKFVQPKPA